MLIGQNGRISYPFLGELTVTGKTGVEMEALCAVNAALLTLYDMAKALDKNMVIEQVRLLSKKGSSNALRTMKLLRE